MFSLLKALLQSVVIYMVNSMTLLSFFALEESVQIQITCSWEIMLTVATILLKL
uniref:Serine/threonine-protein phosphatase PP2A catalytic subunit n=1 Tax=Rhizophora mucronata TaxID=61149 RepID=A0A2P2MMM3_RHIMU